MLKKLEERLKELGKVAIAFSGGIDSSFLLYFANKVLPKEKVLAIIANGQMISREDYNSAIKFLEENDFQYKEIRYDAFEVEAFRENHKDRCYYCKKNLMAKIKEVAIENGFENVLDGKNIDDTLCYRPGNKATEELGIISLLEETGFSKKEIRKYSKQLGIEFWNKPSNSCLATRFPYNTVLTSADLEKVEKAEEIIKKLKIPKVRFRVHENLARIEVEEKYFNIILKNKEILLGLKELGFNYITLDLNGIKSGSFD